MVPKVSRGNSFRGVCDYVAGKAAAARVGGNLAGSTPREWAREFGVTRALRPDVVKPVWTCSLALPPGDSLSNAKWEAVTSEFMGLMGFNPATTMFVVVKHTDRPHEHVHIVASRIGLDGELWHGQWDAQTAIAACQELEKRHSLSVTPGRGAGRAERRALTGSEINMAVRTGKEPPRQRLQRLLDVALQDGPTALEFAEDLHAAGVGVRANIASTGRMSGFSFEIDGVAFPGSKLGKRYGWTGLQKAGVSYDENRDRAGLERLRAAAPDDRGSQGDAAGNEAAAEPVGTARADRRAGEAEHRTSEPERREPAPVSPAQDGGADSGGPDRRAAGLGLEPGFGPSRSRRRKDAAATQRGVDGGGLGAGDAGGTGADPADPQPPTVVEWTFQRALIALNARRLPPDFDQWWLADEDGRTLGDYAASLAQADSGRRAPQSGEQDSSPAPPKAGGPGMGM